MEALNPVLVVPGHRTVAAPADLGAIRFTRAYLADFQKIVAAAPDAATATAELIERYPDAGMQIAARLGPKVVMGETTWG
jgi:hypothetical protein